MPVVRDGVQIVPGAGPDAAAVGAPFDPCRIVGWADFPAAVRPDDLTDLPRLMPVRPGNGFATGCRFNNSASATMRVCRPVCGDDAPDYTLGPTYLVNIVWGTHISTDPTHYGPSTTVERVAGRPMLVTPGRSTPRRNTLNQRDLVDRGTHAVGEPRCTVTLALAHGVAGVAITDGRFGTDPCVSARGLARAIAARAS